MKGKRRENHTLKHSHIRDNFIFIYPAKQSNKTFFFLLHALSILVEENMF